MAQADADTSGKLDTAELASIPALRDSVEVLDTDGDLQISAAEIKAWFERVKKEDIAYDDAHLIIRFKGKPAADVLVKIVPEACMGGMIEPAEGRTDNEGRVCLNMPSSRIPGVRCGLYRLEITGKRPNGKPIPKQFNTETTLGLAVGGGLPQPMTPVIAID